MTFDMKAARAACDKYAELKIERLQAEMKECNQQAKRILDLEQKLLTSECREREAGQRIAELQDALVEERARTIRVPCKFDDAMSICDYSGSDTGWCKNCSQKDKIRKMAREQLRQEKLL